MSKKKFLQKLSRSLVGLAKAERDRYINYYDEMISDMMENGLTEQEAIEKQGNIDDLVRDILQDTDAGKLIKKDKLGIALTAAAIVLAAGSVICMLVLPTTGAVSFLSGNGPTAVFVAGKIREPFVLYIAAGCVGIADIIYHAVKRKRAGLIIGIVAVCCMAGVFFLRDIKKGNADTEKAESGTYAGFTFTETDIEDRTRTIIQLLDAEDYDTIHNQYTAEVMKPYMTKETIDEAKKLVGEDWGSLVSCGNIYSGAITENGTEYVVVQVNVMYANISVAYTLIYDKDMKLAGLYMR